MAALRLLIVEDEPWVRDALVRLMPAAADNRIVVAAACGSAEEALEFEVTEAPLDLALVDLGLPGISGVELIARLRARRPTLRCVAFTVMDDSTTIFAALRAGAQGYLLKSTPPVRVIDALQEVFDGGAPMTASVARIVVDGLRSRSAQEPATGPQTPLTARESDLLALLAKGVTYAEAGKLLGIGLGTVQAYVKNIYKKLEVGSKAEAALEAVKLGLVT